MNGSYGLEFSLFNNHVGGSIEYFTKLTDPLSDAAEGTVPSSVAVNSSYVINVGNLNTSGWNLNLRYSPIYQLEKRIIWTISFTAAQNKSRSTAVSPTDCLHSTKKERESNGLSRYYDGYSARRYLGRGITGHRSHHRQRSSRRRMGPFRISTILRISFVLEISVRKWKE